MDSGNETDSAVVDETDAAVVVVDADIALIAVAAAREMKEFAEEDSRILATSRWKVLGSVNTAGDYYQLDGNDPVAGVDDAAVVAAAAAGY